MVTENGSYETTPHVSLVIPVYNEEDAIATLHREVASALDSTGLSYEVLWIDDGSRDESAKRIRQIADHDARTRLLELDRNHGQSAALDAGFRAARGDIVVTLDSDLQNDPSDIPRLLKYLEQADVVNGVRSQRADSWIRQVSSRIANAFRNWLTHDHTTDVGCSLRAMRASFVKQVVMFQGAHRFLPTLLRLHGARVVEVPVSHRPRRFGQSKYGIRNRLFVGLMDAWAVRWVQSRHLRYRVEEGVARSAETPSTTAERGPGH